ncbi:unnamed protein product [Acanthoscelides obtectus]|uniref:Uncharacterized protein n=1 Tax=Acanthoscelides obtectus TaxID=200917 RepID=A0A9P0NXZ0_ACAOB|nr:unnamed protein product [Acanthoscelides obtectus]CAK1666082.1 U2 small nuclear ribonucleoprotein auxiliary factor 35 kDa subunit-related protein 1 [Acanthoscelides obtectus]
MILAIAIKHLENNIFFLFSDITPWLSRHKEWRKLAKKLRRKRIRQKNAKLRDEKELQELHLREKNPAYQSWLQHKEKEEALRITEEARISEKNEIQWRKNEKEAQIKFKEYQEIQRIAREEREKQNEKIRKEWEQEQKRFEEKKEKERIEKERLNEKVEYFLENGGDTPEHLKISMQTNPNKEVCTFFQKTGACRFGDACSRNHIKPGISRVLLIQNFFSHYSLEKTESEQILDSDLECEHDETYQAFKEFFDDVVDELESYGRIIVFRVCCNREPHLRGNVYIEFATTRAALKCYKGIHGRWYAGKQLTVEFREIKTWKQAVCGLILSKKCPKGSMCNYLHVFKNPKNLFNSFEVHTRNDGDRKCEDSSQRKWRWSESPERVPYSDGWESDDHYNNHRKDSHRSARSSSRRNHGREHSDRRSRRSGSERDGKSKATSRKRKGSSERRYSHRSKKDSERGSRSKRRERSRSSS